MSRLRVDPSPTPLAAEYDAIDAALRRVQRHDVVFDASAYPHDAVALVREQWRTRMVFEHRSSTVFSQLATQLFEANASLDAKVVMLRMSQDELRHTATCAEVVVALGGEADAEASFELERLAEHAGVSPEQRALRNVLYTTSCSEMIACARFVAVLDRMTDPYLREANRRLLADEVLHGQFGFHYLEAWRGWLDVHPDERMSLERYLAHAFLVLERELAPLGPFAPLSEAELALGADDPSLAREVFYGAMEGAIVPGLERLGLDAGRAFRDRRLASA
ncbi:MAG: ferritin-like domain-containing protein [Sandaracinaceae bacterium]